MTLQQRRLDTHRHPVRALRPARVKLILELEYRRAQRDIHQRSPRSAK